MQPVVQWLADQREKEESSDVNHKIFDNDETLTVC
jgi:hypothetical protein